MMALDLAGPLLQHHEGVERVLGDLRPQIGVLPEDLIHSLQKHVEVDEPEVEPEVIADQTAPSTTTNADEEDNVTFDRMSEEELIAGIEGLVAPEKNDDF